MAVLKFNVEGHISPDVVLMLNHCNTNCHGIIDLVLNDEPLITGYKDTRWDNFGEQNFNLPSDMLREGENELQIVLNEESEGVYWLSDLRLDIEYG